MNHEETLARFEQAANSADFDQVAPLIDEHAIFWFTDGSFEGVAEVQRAFEETWATIREETYRIEGTRWIAVSDTVAVCVYRFSSSGIVDGHPFASTGRGTNVLVRGTDGWKIGHEHLSKDPLS
ncbi:MAG: YybH family protein [Acidimicrobiales bacterium]